MSLALLTSSRLRSARACQRLHHIEYTLGYRPAVDADTLRFGTLIHKALEAWWAAPNNRLEAAFAAIAPNESDPFDRVRAEELMRGYDARWGSEPYQLVAVEAEFKTELVNPSTKRPSQTWQLGGKVDGIVVDERGRKLLMEHKTASGDISPGSEYWRRLKMDLQLSVYFAGAAALGHDVEACVYDVIGKPGQKPLKATPAETRKYKKDGTLYAGQRDTDETPEEFRVRYREAIAENPNAYYQRGEVVRLESEMADAMFDVWQTAQQIRESELAGRAPRNPDACIRFGRTCPYFDVCSGEASLDDPTRFKKSAQNPELSPEVQPKEQVA
jgi:hypothetical protein